MSMSATGVQVLGPYVESIWQQLFKHCECNEEGTVQPLFICLSYFSLCELYLLEQQDGSIV